MSTLFVVDDDIIYQRIIKMTLMKSPAFKHVLYYTQGATLLSYLTENKGDVSNLPDVIFLDLNMPGLDGWGVLDAMKEFYNSLCKKIAVYIVTASIIKEDKRRALTYDFVKEFISKPLYRDKITAISQSINDSVSLQNSNEA